MKNKKELRGKIRELSKTIPTKEKEAFSKMIVDNIVSCEEFKKAKIVGLFHEKFLWEPLVYKFFKDNDFFGKTILLPKCKKDSFDYVGGFSKLGNGIHYDTIEPLDGKIYKSEEVDLVVVPGMSFGFDNGERLGMGSGFFDKYLDKYNGFKIGISFEKLLMDEIPVYEWDEMVDAVITEEKIRRFT